MFNINQYLPTIEVILSGVVIYLLKDLAKLIPKELDKVHEEIGQVRFNRMLKAAGLMLADIRSDATIGKFVGDELSCLKGKLMGRYPNITTGDLNLITKGVTAVVEPVLTQVGTTIMSAINTGVVEANKEPFSAVESPVEKVLDKVDNAVTTVEKYYNANGEELIKLIKPIV